MRENTIAAAVFVVKRAVARFISLFGRRRVQRPMRQRRVKAVAQRCGFNNEEHMRAAFIRSIGIPPREYRGRFTSSQSKEKVESGERRVVVSTTEAQKGRNPGRIRQAYDLARM
jgi:methylphosphotriester-DNA--protein-cysteine methyltransferase